MEMEWNVMTGFPTEELCEINCMPRDPKNKSEIDIAIW